MISHSKFCIFGVQFSMYFDTIFWKCVGLYYFRTFLPPKKKKKVNKNLNKIKQKQQQSKPQKSSLSLFHVSPRVWWNSMITRDLTIQCNQPSSEKHFSPMNIQHWSWKQDLNKIFLQFFSGHFYIHSSYWKQAIIKIKLIIFILLISGWEVDNLGQTHAGKNQLCSLLLMYFCSQKLHVEYLRISTEKLFVYQSLW